MLGITKDGELIQINQSGLMGHKFIGFILFSADDLSKNHSLTAAHLVSKDYQQLRTLSLQALHISQSRGQ